jgi:hypothetical protein
VAVVDLKQIFTYIQQAKAQARATLELPREALQVCGFWGMGV